MGKFKVLEEDGEATYHAWTRCVDGRFFFKEDSVKAVIRKMIENLSFALSVELKAFCIMSNHYHLLVTIPDKKSLVPLTEDQWLERFSAIYDVDQISDLKRQFDSIRDCAKTPEAAEQQIAKMLQRFEDRRAILSVFMKELNKRISIYINDRFERRGTMLGIGIWKHFDSR